MGPRAGSDVGDGTGGNVAGSTHRLFLGGAWKIFLVWGVGAAGGEPNCTGVAGVAGRSLEDFPGEGRGCCWW